MEATATFALSSVHVRKVWRRRRWRGESGCIFQALAMVVLGLLVCAHPCLSAVAPVDCTGLSCSSNTNRISPVCRPIPAGIGIDGCELPPQEMWVQEGSCPSIPKPIVEGSVRTSCGEENGLQIVNISWSLPDDESRRAVTGYKINLFEYVNLEDCSILVPASRQQEWFALHLYEELLTCLEGFSISTGSPARVEKLLNIVHRIRVISLPINKSRAYSLHLESSFPVSPWATCFNRTSRSMAVRGKAHQGCLVYHVPANSTAATLPPVSPSTIPSTSPPASQATVISSPQATSPGLSLSPASVATESDSSSSSNASTTAARSEGVTTSDKLVLRGSGLSSTLLALVVVFVTVLLAVCLGGLAYLLHKRAGLRLKSMKEALAGRHVTPSNTSLTSPLSQPPTTQYSIPVPLAIETGVETDVSTRPLPPTALTNGKSYVYISYARSDPHHRLAVQKVADWLHGCGVQVIADFYYPEEVCTAPQMFVERGIESAQHILVVWSPAYAQVWSQDVEETDEGWDMLQSPSLLTRWEVNLARVCLTSMSERNHQVIPVLLISDDDDSELPDVSNVLPVALQACRVYGLGSVATNKDQLDLLRQLHDAW